MSEKELKLYYKKEEVGTLGLSHSVRGELQFSYAEEWINKQRFSLSPRLKVGDPVDNNEVRFFLENILPEGKGLSLLRKHLRVKNDNVFDIIKAIGADTTGAIQFLSNKKNITQGEDFTEIRKEELIERVAQRKIEPIFKWDGKIRLSMAGVQDKLPICIIGNNFGFGQGNLCSTHLLKFNNQDVEHLCLNEYYCMQLAKKIGLSVAECELLDLGEKVLCVKRFDRKVMSHKLVDRVHIIDLCQVKGLSPDQKYERLLGDSDSVKDIWGEANAKNLFNVDKLCKIPAKYKLRILDWVLFNLVIGNCDNHFKNISFFAEGSKLELCPFYDLVSIVDTYPDFSQALAFQVGSSFDLYNIFEFHLKEFSEEAGFKYSFVKKRLTQIIRLIEKEINLEILNLNLGEQKFIEKIKKNIIKKIIFFRK